MLFVGSAIAVFGILYKISFIDEEELDTAMFENGDNAAEARRGNVSLSEHKAQDLEQFESIDVNGVPKDEMDQPVGDKKLITFEEVVSMLRKDLAESAQADN